MTTTQVICRWNEFSIDILILSLSLRVCALDKKKIQSHFLSYQIWIDILFLDAAISHAMRGNIMTDRDRGKSKCKEKRKMMKKKLSLLHQLQSKLNTTKINWGNGIIKNAKIIWIDARWRCHGGIPILTLSENAGVAHIKRFICSPLKFPMITMKKKERLPQQIALPYCNPSIPLSLFLSLSHLLTHSLTHSRNGIFSKWHRSIHYMNP